MHNKERVFPFEELGLSHELCRVLGELGYEAPTPIQVQSIPAILAGKDLIGQAQTGTGKTAAFALPVLNKIDLKQQTTQALVLTPTRELAIQVAEAFKSYAKKQKSFHILPIYGGQSIVAQYRQLERHPQVIVGTPGRVMDHLRRESLSLENLRMLVVDEADEMLSMGFLEDLEWIMQQTPKEKQTALFSATMPKAIRGIAQKYLTDPEEIVIASVASEAALISQSHWVVSGLHKLDALTRILEGGDRDGTLIFVRTKTATMELAEKLEARGHSAAALNGDMTQDARERTVNNFKKGKLDILVATDVAARGLHVDRVSHVINFDVPFDAETYTHRIGRTGRAGRSGTAILFVSPREMGLLRSIERITGKRIPPFSMPSREQLATRRIDAFVTKVEGAIQREDLHQYAEVIETLTHRLKAPPNVLAAAMAALLSEDTPLFVTEPELPEERAGGRSKDGRTDRGRHQGRREHGARAERSPRERGARERGARSRGRFERGDEQRGAKQSAGRGDSRDRTESRGERSRPSDGAPRKGRGRDRKGRKG